MANSPAAGQRHAHSHKLGWSGGLLFAIALVEWIYANRAKDALVLTNAYHDLFDVAFVAVIVYGEHSRQWFKRWHPLRCNLGPLMIIAITAGALAWMYAEFRDHAGDRATPSAMAVVLLVISAAASLNLALEGHRQSGVLSEMLTLHFAEDVLGSLAAGGIAAADLIWQLQTERFWVAIGLAALTMAVAARIVVKASRLIHVRQACVPDPSGS